MGDETARWRRQEEQDRERWRESEKRTGETAGDRRKKSCFGGRKGKMRTVTEKRRVSGTTCGVPNIAWRVSSTFSNCGCVDVSFASEQEKSGKKGETRRGKRGCS